MDPMALYMQQLQAYQAMMMGQDGSPGTAGTSTDGSSTPDLAFSRKPRPVGAFKPYDLKDFEEKNYNVKHAQGYWQLGKLGPVETPELQAKVRWLHDLGNSIAVLEAPTCKACPLRRGSVPLNRVSVGLPCWQGLQFTGVVV